MADVVMFGDTVAQWLALLPHSQTVLGARPLPSEGFSTVFNLGALVSPTP